MRRRALRWAKFVRPLELGNERLTFKPVHSKQISQVIRFFRRYYPDLATSYYRHYLKPDFYRREVALLDRWPAHAAKRAVYLCIVENEKGAIVAAIAGLREPRLPMMVSNVAAVDGRYRDSALFQWMFNLYLKACYASGIEQGLCIADGRNGAAQQVYLNAGLTVCGIDPGGDIQSVAGKDYYIPDIYFYGFLGGAQRKLVPEKYLELVPEVEKLWRKIRARS